MSARRLFKGGNIAAEDSARLTPADVLVEGGSITKIAPDIAAPADCEVIDCTGKILLPALFDVHVHAREPGQEQKENIATCSEVRDSASSRSRPTIRSRASSRE